LTLEDQIEYEGEDMNEQEGMSENEQPRPSKIWLFLSVVVISGLCVAWLIAKDT